MFLMSVIEYFFISIYIIAKSFAVDVHFNSYILWPDLVFNKYRLLAYKHLKIIN